MKTLQKFILPLLIIIGVYLIYTIYFSGSKGLGAFSDFDPNNNAVKEIKVQVPPGQEFGQQGGNFSFMVVDKNGTTLQAFGSSSLPEGIGEVQTVILKGHVNQSGFCTHEVLLD